MAAKAHHVRIKPVMTIHDRKLRLFRIMWERGTVGDGKGFSVKLAVSLVPRLAAWVRYSDGWRATLAFVSVHFVRSYGGRFV